MTTDELEFHFDLMEIHEFKICERWIGPRAICYTITNAPRPIGYFSIFASAAAALALCAVKWLADNEMCDKWDFSILFGQNVSVDDNQYSSTQHTYIFNSFKCDTTTMRVDTIWRERSAWNNRFIRQLSELEITFISKWNFNELNVAFFGLCMKSHGNRKLIESRKYWV